MGERNAPAPPMTLAELLNALSRLDADLVTDGDAPAAGASAQLRFNAVTHDHREVQPGALFVARKGERFDAHDYLPQAVASGAVALLGERPASQVNAAGAPYIRVRDARAALALSAAALNRFPSESLNVTGITGTDGKTTTGYLLHWLLSANHTTGLSSTAGAYIGEAELPHLAGRFTTPEATDVQALLRRFVSAGATHAVLEASSHGFALKRLLGTHFHVGVFTNLSPEHLDHHGTLEEYRAAKGELISGADLSVLNADDPAFNYFAGLAKSTISYGEARGADVRIGRVTPGDGGLTLALQTGGESAALHLPLVGRFNAHNAAAAVAAALAQGVRLEDAAERLAKFGGVPGRMQLISRAPTVIVDFAHTGPALEKALAALRRPAGRLILVVGAAGERDPGKRPLIGRAAALGADHTLFTEEDSRSESTAAILEQLARAAERFGGVRGTTFELVEDRAEAISRAVRMAEPGDVVLLAGKGHERTLERANSTMDWNEAQVAKEALATR